MPTLADIYSAIGSAKRKAADVLQNPYMSAQQMLGQGIDRLRNFSELSRQATEESMATGDPLYRGPINRQVENILAESYNPIGMTVYHGSPHLFERFDLSKIGSGEGAQAYGRGLYMAQSPEVAKAYMGAGTSKGGAAFENQLMKLMEKAQDAGRYGEAGALEDLLVNRNPVTAKNKFSVDNGYSQETVNQAHAIIDKYKDKFTPAGLYKVDLPDTHVRRMLDWDAPLKSQPKQVRDLAKTLGMDLNDLGGDLVARVGKGEEGKQVLQKAGIRGIKYFDQMSRGEETGTRNFVVFDPSHLTILERNSQPIK